MDCLPYLGFEWTILDARLTSGLCQSRGGSDVEEGDGLEQSVFVLTFQHLLRSVQDYVVAPISCNYTLYILK